MLVSVCEMIYCTSWWCVFVDLLLLNTVTGVQMPIFVSLSTSQWNSLISVFVYYMHSFSPANDCILCVCIDYYSLLTLCLIIISKSR